jgi:Flp pilus assembly protein TadD
MPQDDVIQEHLTLFQRMRYSIFPGTLRAERGQYDEAVLYLKRAAQGMPERARVHYNLGVLLDYLQKDNEAEAALLKALELEPDHMDYLRAVAEFYLKRKRFPDAKRIAEHMIRKHPSKELGPRILDFINRNTKP